MKKLFLFVLLGLFLQAAFPVEAQILGKIKKKVQNKVDQKIDQGIDKEIEKTEDVIEGDKKIPFRKKRKSGTRMIKRKHRRRVNPSGRGQNTILYPVKPFYLKITWKGKRTVNFLHSGISLMAMLKMPCSREKM